MTRKHFIAIAEAIRFQWNCIPGRYGNDPECMATARTTLRQTAATLADNLSGFNAQFDRNRFLEACLGENWRG